MVFPGRCSLASVPPSSNKPQLLFWEDASVKLAECGTVLFQAVGVVLGKPQPQHIVIAIAFRIVAMTLALFRGYGLLAHEGYHMKEVLPGTTHC